MELSTASSFPELFFSYGVGACEVASAICIIIFFLT